MNKVQHHKQSSMELSLNPNLVIDLEEIILSQISLYSSMPSHSPCCYTCVREAVLSPTAS